MSSIPLKPHAAPGHGRPAVPPVASTPLSVPALHSALPLQRWELRRNCALSPRQLLHAYLLLCLPTLAAATAALAMGLVWVGVFAAAELLAVAAAMLVYARHACDRETLTLQGRWLAVEQHCGAQVQRCVFDVTWLRVEDGGQPQRLCKLVSQGQALQVGRHVAPARRQALLHEVRKAVARAAQEAQRPFATPAGSMA